MLRIAGLLFILGGLVWLASEIPSTRDQMQPPVMAWRRTAVGWEQADKLQWNLSPRQPAVHPAAFALVMLLFALSGLIGFTPDEPVAPRDLPPPVNI
jgi:hypothetical protein